MGRPKKRIMQSALAVLFSASLVVSNSLPAQAVTWYTFNRWCGSFFTLICSVQYTGSWPDGVVRGVGAQGYEKVVLQTRVGTSGTWLTKTSTTGAVTPSTAVGKDNWYRTCIQTSQGGGLNCLSPQGNKYLGD